MPETLKNPYTVALICALAGALPAGINVYRLLDDGTFSVKLFLLAGGLWGHAIATLATGVVPTRPEETTLPLLMGGLLGAAGGGVVSFLLLG